MLLHPSTSRRENNLRYVAIAWIAMHLACGSSGNSEPVGPDPSSDADTDTDSDSDSDTDSDSDSDTGSDSDSDLCESDVWCQSHQVCCEVGEECVSNMECQPICETERCGPSELDCCGSDEICVEGFMCAKQCDDMSQLCGDALDTCCEADELCVFNECVVPGDTCGDKFDCPDDSYYCEPLYDQCFELPEGELCEGTPEFTEIAPILEWKWEGVTYQGALYKHVIASPAVGDVTGDGIPDIVITAGRPTSVISMEMDLQKSPQPVGAATCCLIQIVIHPSSEAVRAGLARPTLSCGRSRPRTYRVA
ncbi:MAG: FG-GAP repeat protein [Myxococcota bacterium]|nr:FG-GAP repeat protein [Myxococcota bacterium]